MKKSFSQCETIASDAAALVAALEATLPARSRLLYLCGKVRRPDLEISLGATGTEIIPVEVYDTISVSYTTEKMVSTLRAAPVDAVLVYSLEAAEALLHFLQWPTIAQAFPGHH